MQLTQLLKKHFGYETFRPLQEEIISDVISGKDVFALMPTGGGKSLCYQLPALALSGVTLVVSPLISLMKDQVDSLTQNGIPAAFLNSSLTNSEKEAVKQKLLNNQLKLLYLAPERLAQDNFRDFLKQIKVSLIAIDEAHCISEWGHDFRPEYRELRYLKTLLPNTPIIALTATATQRVKEDIITELGLQNAQKYQASFNRSNLFYFVLPKRGIDQVIEYAQRHVGQSGIVYCQSKKSVDSMTEKLKAAGISALPYHAGLSDKERKEYQEAFIKEDVDIIVATIAFGMGIDKPNVRYVFHYDLPGSLERYYQETGRPGRDGLKSSCFFLYNFGDSIKIKYFINQKPPKERTVATWQLQQVLNFASQKHCRRQQLLRYFGEPFNQPNCQSCDFCLYPDKQVDFFKKKDKKLEKLERQDLTFDKNLFEILRSLRKSLADQQNVPPYVIFPDTALEEMSHFYPQTLDQFSKIKGVGQEKLKKYGQIFVDKISEYSSKNNLAPIQKSEPPKPPKDPKIPTIDQTLTLYNQGLTPDQIAQQRGVQKRTIIEHLAQAYEKGNQINLDELVSPQKQQTIKELMLKDGFDRLAPIKIKLGESYSYDEIRLVQALLRRQKSI